MIIFTLDTLANIKIKGKPDINQKTFSNYSDVKEDVENRVKWFLEKETIANLSDSSLKEKMTKLLNSRRIKIVVAPGVGSFKNIKVEGEMLDFYHYALYKLSKELPTGSMKVYLDLTHGINFMPTLLYRALNNLLGLAAFVNNCRFVVLNSEPYPQGFSKEEKDAVVSETVLRIRVVEDRFVQPKPIYSKVKDRSLATFISSLTNGFPLVFTTFYPEIDKLKKSFINEELENFLRNIEIKSGNVKRKKCLSEDFKTSSKIYYLIRVLNASNKHELPKTEVSIDDLECLIELIFKKITRLEVITKRDVRQIRDVVKKASKKDGEVGDRLRSGEKLLYLDVYNFAKDKNFDRKDKIDPRDFIAHSGLISDRIYVRLDNGKMTLSYGDLEEIMNLSIKSMWGDRGD